MTIAEDIKAASDSLTPDNWYQGSYFKAKNGIVCMCAHGALQAQVNQDVKAALVNSDAAAAERAAGGAIRAAAAARVAAGASYSDRPSWVNDTHTEAHYVLGMVGLTARFNDQHSTTLADVRAKFADAETLAKELGI